MVATKKRQCRRSTKYGTCHRSRGHAGVHATYIGEPAVYFAWDEQRRPLGYGHFSHGRFSAYTQVKEEQ